MAKFKAELPTELIKEIKKINDNTYEIIAEMTEAGARVVYDYARNNAPDVLKPYAKISRTYRTPSDDGINTQVYFSGYIPFSDPNREWFSRSNGYSPTVYKTNRGVPAEFLGVVFEYGRSYPPFPKKPFLRKSFKKGAIEKAILEAQKRASGGLLDE